MYKPYIDRPTHPPHVRTYTLSPESHPSISCLVSRFQLLVHAIGYPALGRGTPVIGFDSVPCIYPVWPLKAVTPAVPLGFVEGNALCSSLGTINSELQ